MVESKRAARYWGACGASMLMAGLYANAGARASALRGRSHGVIRGKAFSRRRREAVVHGRGCRRHPAGKPFLGCIFEGRRCGLRGCVRPPCRAARLSSPRCGSVRGFAPRCSTPCAHSDFALPANKSRSCFVPAGGRGAELCPLCRSAWASCFPRRSVRPCSGWFLGRPPRAGWRARIGA